LDFDELFLNKELKETFEKLNKIADDEKKNFQTNSSS